MSYSEKEVQGVWGQVRHLVKTTSSSSATQAALENNGGHHQNQPTSSDSEEDGPEYDYPMVLDKAFSSYQLWDRDKQNAADLNQLRTQLLLQDTMTAAAANTNLPTSSTRGQHCLPDGESTAYNEQHKPGGEKNHLPSLVRQQSDDNEASETDDYATIMSPLSLCLQDSTSVKQGGDCVTNKSGDKQNTTTFFPQKLLNLQSVDLEKQMPAPVQRLQEHSGDSGDSEDEGYSKVASLGLCVQDSQDILSGTHGELATVSATRVCTTLNSSAASISNNNNNSTHKQIIMSRDHNPSRIVDEGDDDTYVAMAAVSLSDHGNNVSKEEEDAEDGYVYMAPEGQVEMQPTGEKSGQSEAQTTPPCRTHAQPCARQHASTLSSDLTENVSIAAKDASTGGLWIEEEILPAHADTKQMQSERIFPPHQQVTQKGKEPQLNQTSTKLQVSTLMPPQNQQRVRGQESDLHVRCSAVTEEQAMTEMKSPPDPVQEEKQPQTLTPTQKRNKEMKRQKSDSHVMLTSAVIQQEQAKVLISALPLTNEDEEKPQHSQQPQKSAQQRIKQQKSDSHLLTTSATTGTTAKQAKSLELQPPQKQQGQQPFLQKPKKPEKPPNLLQQLQKRKAGLKQENVKVLQQKKIQQPQTRTAAVASANVSTLRDKEDATQPPDDSKKHFVKPEASSIQQKGERVTEDSKHKKPQAPADDTMKHFNKPKDSLKSKHLETHAATYTKPVKEDVALLGPPNPQQPDVNHDQFPQSQPPQVLAQVPQLPPKAPQGQGHHHHRRAALRRKFHQRQHSSNLPSEEVNSRLHSSAPHQEGLTTGKDTGMSLESEVTPSKSAPTSPILSRKNRQPHTYKVQTTTEFPPTSSLPTSPILSRREDHVAIFGTTRRHRNRRQNTSASSTKHQELLQQQQQQNREHEGVCEQSGIVAQSLSIPQLVVATNSPLQAKNKTVTHEEMSARSSNDSISPIPVASHGTPMRSKTPLKQSDTRKTATQVIAKSSPLSQPPPPPLPPRPPRPPKPQVQQKIPAQMGARKSEKEVGGPRGENNVCVLVGVQESAHKSTSSSSRVQESPNHSQTHKPPLRSKSPTGTPSSTQELQTVHSKTPTEQSDTHNKTTKKATTETTFDQNSLPLPYPPQLPPKIKQAQRSQEARVGNLETDKEAMNRDEPTTTTFDPKSLPRPHHPQLPPKIIQAQRSEGPRVRNLENDKGPKLKAGNPETQDDNHQQIDRSMRPKQVPVSPSPYASRKQQTVQNISLSLRPDGNCVISDQHFENQTPKDTSHCASNRKDTSHDYLNFDREGSINSKHASHDYLNLDQGSQSSQHQHRQQQRINSSNHPPPPHTVRPLSPSSRQYMNGSTSASAAAGTAASCYYKGINKQQANKQKQTPPLPVPYAKQRKIERGKSGTVITLFS